MFKCSCHRMKCDRGADAWNKFEEITHQCFLTSLVRHVPLKMNMGFAKVWRKNFFSAKMAFSTWKNLEQPSCAHSIYFQPFSWRRPHWTPIRDIWGMHGLFGEFNCSYFWIFDGNFLRLALFLFCPIWSLGASRHLWPASCGGKRAWLRKGFGRQGPS